MIEFKKMESKKKNWEIINRKKQKGYLSLGRLSEKLDD